MIELNMDGLVGPTHHYAGLSSGNIASMENAGTAANPKAAALQGLEKMRILHEMGIPQAFLPPHARPHLPLLRQLGFEGSSESIINQAFNVSPSFLSAAFSSSHMWAANAATVTSSRDSKDGKTHFTAANLNANIHRHIESSFTSSLLEMAFASEEHFYHHPPLPSTAVLGDEGAANHTRLGLHNHSGIHLFVYGQVGLKNNLYPRPKRYNARQTLEASQQIAYTHGLVESNTVFAYQNPDAIDHGVFHNDVVSVGNENILLIHQSAYLNQENILSELNHKSSSTIKIYQVNQSDLSINDAVKTYLFNSQIITLPNNQGMLIVAPSECEQSDKVLHLINNWLNDNDCPINKAIFLDLKQSMRNGGGPACLRLRVPLTNDALQKVNPGFLIDDSKLIQLEGWINKHYREQLTLKDLCDPHLIDEVFQALDELSKIMGISNLYPFQK